MINKVILIGRITADPEIRYTQSGIPVLSFSIACERRFKTQSGEKITDFINCVAWRKTAELMGQYVKKGYLLGIDGTLHQDRYQTKEGENRSTYKVQVDNVEFLDRGGKGGGGGQDYTPSYSDEDAPPEPTDTGSYGGGQADEDDLPF